jgi:hypothetical protein
MLVYGLCWPTIINIPADYPTIQQGIDANLNGDTVLVQPETYVENINFNGDNIVLGSLFLTTGDTSYIEQTIIDGDSAGSVVTFESWEDSTALIKGFSIINGYSEWGGGIRCDSSGPSIIFNYIIDNYADSMGGGISCYSSDPIIKYSYISENNCGNSFYGGGGIGCRNGSSPVIGENSIIFNRASSTGGGIYCTAYSSPEIYNNLIADNYGYDEAGGIAIESNSIPIVTGNIITGNYGYIFGGGIYIYNSTPTISQNIIEYNHASFWGGGIFCGGDAVIENNIIKNNNSYERGGGIYIWANPVLQYNVIKSNTSELGGGIYSTTNSWIISDVIVNNNATAGGGIWCNSSTPFIINSIFWRNTADDGPEIHGQPVVRYSDVQGGWQGNGNIDADPLFVDTYNDNYNVCAQSPCIDSGDPNRTDPDSTRSDIGLFFYDHPVCEIGNLKYVSIDGNDTTGNGSFENPYRTIQHSINISSNHDSIIVMNGRYVENIVYSGKNLFISSYFHFSGDTLDIQNTIIDGDSAGTVVTFNGFEDSTAILNGFTITNGASHWYGGGINCNRASPIISFNIIKENYDTHSGAIHCMFANPRITKNIIRDNFVTEWAGGIDCYESDPEISNNIIINNTAMGLWGGGGIYCMSSNPSIKNNVIVNNQAIYGAGILLRNRSNPEIINNTICFNHATDAGGGIYVFGYGGGNAIVKNSIIWGNSAVQSGDQIEGDLFASYCDIQGGWNGPGNIDSDPMFRDTSNYDYRLMSVDCGYPENSLCIDVGHYDIFDSLLDCSWGLGIQRSDLGAYGGGSDSPHIGHIINIPGDFATIQEGITWSYDGDTVLIHPGIYGENINFSGHNITMGSLFLTTGDTAYISNTIIDGDSSGTVVTFNGGENNSAQLIGLTIQNGADENGGGIACYYSDPLISNNVINNNYSTRGGGIYCLSCDMTIINNRFVGNRANFGGGTYADSSNHTIQNNLFFENSAFMGAGIYFRYSSPIVNLNLIVSNSASEGGGIFAIYSQGTIDKNTIYSNFASLYGGGFYSYRDEGTVISNCIFWNDSSTSGDEIYYTSTPPTIIYCDVEGGWNGQGNINLHPLFCDPDVMDFTLRENSPCIGSGQNGVDMGAFGIGCEPSGIGNLSDNAVIPTVFALYQNYPNPFNARTNISFDLPEAGEVSIIVYNILGRQIGILLDNYWHAGTFTITLGASHLSSGVYFYRLQAGNYTETRKMILLK